MVTEIFEIEHGDESQSLANLDSSDNQNSEARIKTIYYLLDFYCKSFKLSIEILLEEIRPIVIDNYEMEFRYKSIKTFDSWQCLDFDAKNRMTES